MENNSIPEAKARDIILCDRIDEHSVRDVIKQIIEINADDEKKSEIYLGWDRKPIRLYISSPGGSVYDGMGLYDVVTNSKTPVHTICTGKAFSMGFVIWMAGAKRLMGKNATLMFHDLSTMTYGKTEDLKCTLAEMTRLQKLIVDEIVAKSEVKEEKLREIISKQGEWYIPSSEALELKLADDYYS